MVFPASHEAQHLCVLVHGLWGNPNHLEYMANSLRAKHPQETLHILVAKRNSGSFTYDGIELGGERVCQEIEEEIAKLYSETGQEIKRLSLVGYSLGGLVARYACGLLYSKGFFDKIEPVNFTTFASPHLGVRTPLLGWHNHIWNVLGARTLSASGRQLFTVDSFRNTGKPLLEVLAEPESIFLKGLALHKRRTLYTNIVNDRSAVYYTTGISKTDPFTNLKNIKINYLEGYDNVILDPEMPIAPADSESQVSGGLIRDFKTRFQQIPIIFAVVIFVPFGIVAFLLNSVVQSVRSSRRIRLHESGLAGIQPGNYRVPLLVTGMREAVEDVYENINSAQSNEYLADGSEDEDDDDEPGSPALERIDTRQSNGTANGKDTEKPTQHEVPTLALAPYQFRMIKALDTVGWRKYPVYIHNSNHSHAAIIVRKPNKESLFEGKTVIRHWLDEEFIV